MQAKDKADNEKQEQGGDTGKAADLAPAQSTHSAHAAMRDAFTEWGQRQDAAGSTPSATQHFESWYEYTRTLWRLEGWPIDVPFPPCDVRLLTKIRGIGAALARGGYHWVHVADHPTAAMVFRLPVRPPEDYMYTPWRSLLLNAAALQNSCRAALHGGVRIVTVAPVRCTAWPAQNEFRGAAAYVLLRTPQELADAMDQGCVEVAVVLKRADTVLQAAQRMVKAGFCSLEAASFLGCRTLDSVMAMWDAGLFHPDVKVGNVLVRGMAGVTPPGAKAGGDTDYANTIKVALADNDDVVLVDRYNHDRQYGHHPLDVHNPLEWHAYGPGRVDPKVLAWQSGVAILSMVGGRKEPVLFRSLSGAHTPMILGVRDVVMPAEMAALLAGLMHPDPEQRAADLRSAQRSLEAMQEEACGLRLARAVPTGWGGQADPADVVHLLSRYLKSCVQAPHPSMVYDHAVKDVMSGIFDAMLFTSSSGEVAASVQRVLQGALDAAVLIDRTALHGPVMSLLRCNASRRNVLHMAVAAGNSEAVWTLIDACRRCDHEALLVQLLGEVDALGNTPLQLGLASLRTGTVKLLLDWATEHPQHTDWLRKKDTAGRSVLHALVRWPLVKPQPFAGSARRKGLPEPQYGWRPQLANFDASRVADCLARFAALSEQLKADLRASFGGELRPRPEPQVAHLDDAALSDPAVYTERRRDLLTSLLGVESLPLEGMFGQMDPQRECVDAGNTPLHCAAANGDFVALEVMTQHPRCREIARQCLTVANQAGRNPLEEAHYCNPLLTSEAAEGLLGRLQCRTYPFLGETVHQSYGALRRWLRAHNDQEAYKRFYEQSEGRLAILCRHLWDR